MGYYNLPATRPKAQFIMEVHAMNVGLGATFRQKSRVNKIHSCAWVQAIVNSWFMWQWKSG